MENFRRFLKKYFISVLVILFASVIGIIIFEMLQMSNKITKSTALENADIYVQAIESFRTLYTSRVVERIRARGVTITHNYNDIEGAIPLPATLTNELGIHVEKNAKEFECVYIATIHSRGELTAGQEMISKKKRFNI